MIGIEKLVHEIEKKAKTEEESIIREAKEKAEEIMKQAEKEAKQKREKIEEENKRKIEFETSRIIADAEIRVRMKYLEEREKIINKVMKQVKDSIKKRTFDKKKYKAFLEKRIKEAVKELSTKDVIIHLNKRDKEIYDSLKMKYEVVYDLDEPGVIIETRSGVKIDNTLSNVIETDMDAIRQLITKEIR